MAKEKEPNSRTVKKDSKEAQRIEKTHGFAAAAARKKARAEKAEPKGDDSK